MQAVVLVVGILVVVGLLQAAIWIPLVRRWRRRRAAAEAAFEAEVSASGERIVIPRESAIYRGCTGSYGQVKGNGTIVLTERRLLFRKLTGGAVEVPVAKITGLHRAKAFNGSRVGGRTHLVLTTSDPAEVGFFVTDLDRWESALTGLVSPRA